MCIRDRAKHIYKFDSINGFDYIRDQERCRRILQFFTKARMITESDKFENKCSRDLPKQENPDDCGLEVCLNARAIHTQGFQELEYQRLIKLQKTPKELRKRTAIELVKQRLYDL